jgi:glutamate N-acetyltransferase/amino-acid N-acetyltransferase
METMAGKGTLPVSPLAPKRFPRLTPIAGVKLASVAAGERYAGRHDLMLATMPRGTTVAGTLTRNRMPGQPVVWCRRHLPAGKARALLVNAGNANVFTGRAGELVIAQAVAAVADLTRCPEGEVFVASTGVIGQQIRIEKVLSGIPKAAKQLSEKNWAAAARAICTTDTYPKGATRTAEIGGKTVHLTGFCKGSGMIMPDMATMLCFVFTDAKLPAPVLRSLLRRGVDRSFNCITVDGDTSTSDTVLLFATGEARHRNVDGAGDPALAGFRAALDDLLLDLAHQVVKDGEGASKFIEVNVRGAENAAAARNIGLSIGNSPLVKTALAAGDANWGRIVMAVGKAGETADRDRLSIAIGGIPIAIDGYLNPDYREETVVPHMKGEHIVIDVDLGIGRGKATVWTCDLTHQYISINADYRS